MTYTSLGEAHFCLVCAHQLRPSRDRLDTAFQALGLVEGLSLSINTRPLSCAEDLDPGEGHEDRTRAGYGLDRTSLHCGLGRKGVWTGKGCS